MSSEKQRSEFQKSAIENEKELEFAIFCIENIAIKENVGGEQVYDALIEGGILDGYIIPCYDVLHTQGKDYIVNDILEVMRERGVEI